MSDNRKIPSSAWERFFKEITENEHIKLTHLKL